MTITTLITGTTKGIGNRLCKHYIEKNHKIISISRSDIDFTHKNLLHFKQDITDKMCLQNVNNIINNEKIDNCIINAGIYNNSFFHKMTFEQWFDTINTNLLSIYNVLNPVLNNMRLHKNGNIILMSSVVGKTGLVGGSNYSCSKSAIYGLTKSLALENSQKNILINSISPGYINIGMGDQLNTLHKQKLCEHIPLNKFGDVSDIINLTDYLIEKNRYITGSNININGGMI